MKSDKKKKITDHLIGQDERVCSCSVRIANLIRSGSGKEESGPPPLKQILAALKRKKEGSRKG